MALRVSTTGFDVEIIDLGITVVHPTTNRDLTLEFTALELKGSSDLTQAIQNGDLDADDGTHFIHEDDYDPDEVLIQELGYNRDELYISHDELASTGKSPYLIVSGVFPLDLNSVAQATKNVYCPSARFITWQADTNDIVEILGCTASGLYTIDSVTDQQNFVLNEAVVDSTGGTINIYHPPASTKIGCDDTNFVLIEGEDLQTVLESIDDKLVEGGFSDELVKVSSNDTTASYLANKVVAGKNITTAEVSDGGNEQLRINASCYEDLVYEPTGFTNDVRSTISWVNGTRTFTIAPISTSFEYYIRGVEYSKSSPESVIIPDTEGLWFIYYDGATLSCSQSFWDLGQDIPVAIVYWDATNKKEILFGDERHKLTMDWATHARLHLGVGTVKERYTLDLINYTLRGDGSQDSHAQVGYEDGTIYDEDLAMDIVHSNTPSADFEQYLRTYAKIPMYYRDGANGDWRREDATNFPIIHDSPNLVKCNEVVSGVWSLESCTDRNYVCTWVCATNSISEPIIGIVGQQQSDSFLDASSQDFGDIATGLPFQEYVLLDKLIFRTSTDYTNIPKAILYSISKETYDQDTDIVGALTRLTFAYNSTAGDRWLDYEHYNVSSFYVPGVIQYKIEIRGVSFSNRLANADVDIEFYINGTDPGNKVFTLEVRNCQYAYDSDIDPITLNPGDLVYCYIKKQAVAAQSPIIQFEGKVVDATTTSGSG